MKKLGLLAVFAIFTGGLLALSVSDTTAQTADTDSRIIMFGRDDCGYCKKQIEFLTAHNLPYQYLNIVESKEAKALYDAVTEKHGLTKVTPVTVIGERVVLGYNSDNTTGAQIIAALEAAENSDIVSIEDHLERAPVQTVVADGGCSDLSCGGTAVNQFEFDLPFLGVVDLQTLSLFMLSALLGVIDGFNPCAMWVLIMFLTILSQAGSKQKMVFMAGLFIVAEAIMYNLILNVWYQTWDFVALDQIVTPLVGILALGGGGFFLWRWYKNKDTQLVCDITDIETQSKTIDKIQAVVQQPVTIASVLAILIIAFSVNVIEFACSIGIPQAYTKILELNMLTFLERQWYIFVYTIGYMIDDFVVFGLAIWGYSKLESHGGKYAQLSLLIGGLLMLLLGGLLVFNPSALVL